MEKELLRYKRLNPCKECIKRSATCGTGTACNIVKEPLRSYNGVRFTSDGFDCALPVSIDSHSACSFSCMYCFAPNLPQKRECINNPVGQTNLKSIENIFSGKDTSESANLIRKALKYDNKRNGYPCPVQLSALTDAFDNIERNQGWFLEFAKIIKKYNQPVRISTKGNLFLEDEYLNAVSDRPELFWVNFSIISCDDEMLQLIDRRAPTATERIESIRRLSKVGIKTGLRFRPILPGISDSTKKYPQAWKTLIDKCVDAGIKAISYEVAFLPGMMSDDIRERWQQIEKIVQRPLINIYNSFGDKYSCIRPPYTWTEEIMWSIYEEAKKNNLHIGISDPNWKQLNTTGCCCGIPPDDPIFGNWQVESATNRLIEAKAGRNEGKITLEDITPAWAYETKSDYLFHPGVGPLVRYSRKHGTWSDKLKEIWNNPEKERSPLNYFQGALIPYEYDKNGNLIYKYEGLKKRNTKNTPYWNIIK